MLSIVEKCVTSTYQIWWHSFDLRGVVGRAPAAELRPTPRM